ncbi:MAG: ribosome-associated translation inhibitor RaiA [bacterium]|nr:ribosome-associated translation inhibitor RaiA [bacterium]
MVINIHAVNIELTPSIRQYVEEKMNSLEKYDDSIVLIDVDLGKDTNHHMKGDIFVCSAKVEVPGDLIVVEKTTETLYKAVDKVRDHLREMLAGRKEKELERGRKIDT